MQMEYFWNAVELLLRGPCRNPTYTTGLTMDDLIRDFQGHQETIWAQGQQLYTNRRHQQQNQPSKALVPRNQMVTTSTAQTYYPREQYYQSSRSYKTQGQNTSSTPKQDKPSSSQNKRDDKPPPKPIEGLAHNDKKMITANQGNPNRFRRRYFPQQRAYQAEADDPQSANESQQETSDQDALYAGEQSTSDDDELSQTGQDYEATAQLTKVSLPQPTPATCHKCKQSFPS